MKIVKELADKYDINPLVLRAWAWQRIYYVKYRSGEIKNSGST